MDFLASIDWVKFGSVLLMLFFISVLIIAHEMGHFFVARRCGVKVERFGFGLPFGPTLWSKKIGDVEYCIHSALFGGYVAFPDDDPDNPLPKDSPERFENKPIGARFAVMVAGVTVNAILGWLLMFWVIMGWGLPSADVAIVETFKNHPAAEAGLMSGDRIARIDGKPIEGYLSDERQMYVRDYISHHSGKTMTLTVERPVDAEGNPLFAGIEPGTDPNAPVDTQAAKARFTKIFEKFKAEPAALKAVDVKVTPSPEGLIGVKMAGHPERYIRVDNPLLAAGLSTRFLGVQIQKQFQAFGFMFAGKMGLKDLSGPIGIVNVGSDVIKHDGVVKGLIITAIISIILAVMNLLPIPALDGGHILFLLIEFLKGSPVKQEVRERVTQYGFLALLALIGFILINDINNTFINPTTLP